jgi:hypothetical protein
MKRIASHVLGAASIFVLGLSSPTRARADGLLDACSAAAVDGQKLERAGRLLEAKARFESCARQECRLDIVQDCSTWMQALERRTPSIVVDVHDERGAGVTDVSVTVDGAAIARETLARPIRLDPGTHAVVFARGGTRIVRSVDLHEGERLDVSTVFASQPTSPARPIPAGTYVSGAIAALGLTAFGVVGGVGFADWRGSRCDVSCSQADATRVHAELLIADVSLGIGVVAAGVATWLYLVRPSERESSATAKQRSLVMQF